MKQLNGIFLSLILMLPLAACAEQAKKDDIQNTEKAKAVEYGVPAKSAEAGNEMVAENTTVAKASFSEGAHFVTLPKRVTPLVPSSKIEVIEMFYYGCPHCFNLEPHAVGWAASAADDVVFTTMPAALNPSWAMYARAYYAADKLGILGKTHETLFKSLHEQGRLINSEDALVRFYVRMGADEAEFKKAMNSPAIAAKVKRAEMLGRDFGLTGVPSLIVDGQYRVLLDNISGYDELFDIVDFLLEKVRDSRSQKS